MGVSKIRRFMRLCAVLVRLYLADLSLFFEFPLWHSKTHGVKMKAHQKYLIALGCTHVDPDAYDGWDGACPGCDMDVEQFSDYTKQYLYNLLCDGYCGESTFLNSAATKDSLKHALKVAGKRLSSGDLLILYVSGHGGQVKDDSGDESDGLDETICLYDGELVDDELGAWLDLLPVGLNVLFVSDTCNSGTNYRSRHGGKLKPRHATFGKHCEKKKINLLHFGGCDDGKSSFGEKTGGAFTKALLKTLFELDESVTYREWFFLAAEKMDVEQIPAMIESGESFADNKFE